MLKVMLDEGAILPSRAHPTDAGLDLYTREDKVIPARGYGIFDSGVHIEIPEGYVGLLLPKSGLNVKHDILSFGVIDSGYTGSIVVKLYNQGDTPYEFNKGEKITQIVLIPVLLLSPTQVDSFEETSRGESGFGSTGK